MKKLLLACAIILSLCILGGCSKDDDGPSSGGKVKGIVKVDGKSFDVKYGYRIDDGDEIEYWFSDKEVLKYLQNDVEGVDVEFSSLLINYSVRTANVDDVVIGYKINNYRETGTYYESARNNNLEKYISFSDNKGTVKCSSEAFLMIGYTYGNDDDLGSFEASFSFEGKTTNISLSDAYPDTRSISVTEISEPKQIAFLKSLSFNNRNLSKQPIQ